MKLAGLQLSRQQLSACIDTYQGAIGLDANNAHAWLGLGFAYLHNGQDALAMAAFNQAVRADPSTQEKLTPLLAKLMAGAPIAD
ncbi:MAG: tetratricopeptide repeat protein [Gammaproteobacteria bacterium]|uniref:tetratricopeptide repeat protein n=1 Tax=Rhodoferax sp. TaxID=50421 RepID=UPI00180EF485|nr:tetratricopeptide repeat protein [Rhodoferax sp.]MBU3900713.1 tetratricopeptide repeat protein [Gammaproteobacteria bacterium]MBA3056903.1 tetratricopeptide repeat protein [Rhodoferax sp.]MBU3997209.1 tetratricopeptide repeat protein [Gammaproteobacteria bacterium]MBU4079464.1 tetratricopeptide repeat protein [Gammaproteobacteria bacterium]MBU4115119.1 tetratricopeptide repeat protein [Gammaproteobacteria bacterium]